MGPTQPIGVFDSGTGGLTVLAALRRQLPDEHFVYFGDTARVPYGIKSTLTVRRYSHQNAIFLRRFSPKLICVACNTSTAAGLDVVTDAVGVPVVGVVEPGARRAAEACPSGAIGIIGTESTIASRCYYRAIRAILPQAELWEKACPLLVPMVEEGRDCDDPLVAAAVREYLAPLQGRVCSLVLGCTHYPLLKDALARTMGPEVHLVDSAEEVAREVA
ncbi:MAG: glutamate racemase, partial [Planctomycetes bacterium]|nr:glutamate racemase [Planctomycetota bacterium]